MPTPWFEFSHHGAVDGVTGSCHELRFCDGAGILVDCGMFQGDEAAKNSDGDGFGIDFAIEHIAALVVTHVHIDHVGRIPNLLAAGFRGPIYCSEPSAELLPLVLEDALKIGVTRDKKLIEQFLTLIKTRLRPLPYRRWQKVIDDSEHQQQLSIRFQPAGHILGSAYVECQLEQINNTDQDSNAKPKREQHRVVFSGDLGAPHAPLLPTPKPPYQADTLVIESTYGDRQHENRKARRDRLRAVIEKALLDGGTVLIPAFSIGRTQELLYELEGLIHDLTDKPAAKDWQQMQILVDSPLASEFTQVYRKLKPFWDAEALQRLSQGRHPLDFDQLFTINSHEQHITAVNRLRSTGEPCIVIAASGMCAGGRMVNYLKALIEDERTDIVFVGYQAKGTPGRMIQQYAGKKDAYVLLDDERFELRAQVHSISGYSAHADQRDLLNFIRRMRKPPKQVRVVHGDDRAKRAFAEEVRKVLPLGEVLVP
ncbi:MAG: MBL fold metallo-hydrolase RNA specificity domain-containing protein [Cellvibrionaceae bacterium]